MPYVVYILECSDGSLYTGVTNNLKRRLVEHNTGKLGAKYTSARRPVVLKYQEECATKGEALKREYQIKSLSREAKLAMLAS